MLQQTQRPGGDTLGGGNSKQEAAQLVRIQLKLLQKPRLGFGGTIGAGGRGWEWNLRGVRGQDPHLQSSGDGVAESGHIPQSHMEPTKRGSLIDTLTHLSSCCLVMITGGL